MLDGTLMTPADTSTEAAASQSQTDGAASAAPAEGQAQQQESQAAAGGADTVQPTEGTDTVEGQGKEAEALVGAPEAYAEFVMPEGVKLDPEVDTELKTVAKELNLTQDQAQKLADLGAKQAERFVKASTDNSVAIAQAWINETKADPEIGGAKLDATVASAKVALDKFGSPALKALLNGSGLGNHPEFVRVFAKVGQAISEDQVTTGGTEAPPGDRLRALYPSMPH